MEKDFMQVYVGRLIYSEVVKYADANGMKKAPALNRLLQIAFQEVAKQKERKRTNLRHG